MTQWQKIYFKCELSNFLELWLFNIFAAQNPFSMKKHSYLSIIATISALLIATFTNLKAQCSVSIFPGTATVCSGGSTSLRASGATTYTWTPSTGLNTTLGDSVIASPSFTTVYTVTATQAGDSVNCTATVMVTVNALPTITVSGQTTICAGGSTPLTASGATTYNWSPGAGLSNSGGPNVTASPGFNTNYTVTGTSANGCSNTAVVSISVLAPPSATITTVNPTCYGSANGSLTTNVSGGTPPYTYTWNNSATTNSLNNVAAGYYSVTVTDANGCHAGDSAYLTQPSSINVSNPVFTNPTCNGASNGSINLGGITGGTAPYTYLWSNGATTNNNTSLAAGSYTVTITDNNGCTKTADTILTQPAPIITTAITHNATCYGLNNGSAYDSVQGGVKPLSYNWSNGATNSIIAGVLASSYTVTVTDNNGCTGTATAIIGQPAPINGNLLVVNASCGKSNGNITAKPTGGTAPYTYSWSNGATTNLIYNMPVAAYTVTIKDSNACQVIDSATILTPAPLSVTANSTNASCGTKNGTATAIPSGGSVPYNYSWTTVPAQTGVTAGNLAAGSYSVTVTDGFGCTATAGVTVTASSGPAISPTITQSTCGASNGAISVNVTGGTAPYRYSWNNGDTVSSNNNLPSGTYIITVNDAANCSTYQAINITDAGAPTVTVNSITNVACNSDTSGSISITVTGGATPYKYAWSNTATTQNINDLSAGPYQVSVTDANGCTIIQAMNVTEPAPLSLTTNSIFAGCGSADGGANVSVTGGTKPYQYSWSTGSTISSISNLAVGTYSVTVTDSNTCATDALVSVSNASGPLVTLDSVVNFNCVNKTLGDIVINATGGTPPYNYAWTNGASTQNIYDLTSGNYGVTVTDAAGCAGSASAKITTALPQGVSICMATVDPSTGFINLAWDPDLNSRIKYYYIYRETTAPGIFNIIGHSSGSSGLYVDTISNSGNRSWAYEISELDSCGQSSPISQSVLFKTIHLTTTLANSTTVDLVWDNFEGATFTHYIIYRDSVPGITYDSIASVSPNTFGYVDTPPMSYTGTWFYHVGIGGATGCSSHGPLHGIEAINYNASKSNTGNIYFNPPLNVQNMPSVNSLNIFPNPTRGMFNLSMNLNKQQTVVVKIYDDLGQLIEQENYTKQNGKMVEQYDMSAYAKGIYTIQVITSDGVTYRRVVLQ